MLTASEREALTVRLDHDLVDRLRDAAREHSRSVNGEIQAAVKEHLRIAAIRDDVFDSEVSA